MQREGFPNTVGDWLLAVVFHPIWAQWFLRADSCFPLTRVAGAFVVSSHGYRECMGDATRLQPLKGGFPGRSTSKNSLTARLK